MFHCFSEPFFTNCDFHFGTDTVTIDLFGLDGTHHGIPVPPPVGCPPIAPGCAPNPTPDNFFINLNDAGPCDADGCHPGGARGIGGWVPFSTVTVIANTPEPVTTWVLVLGGAAMLLARARMARNDPNR